MPKRLKPILAGIADLARALRHRRAVHRIAMLDEHLLADIGLRRTDVRAALAQPLLRDPLRLLKAACCGTLEAVLRDRPAPGCC